MRSVIVLAIATLSIAACTYRSETVEHQSASGRSVVTESSSIGTPTVVVREHN